MIKSIIKLGIKVRTIHLIFTAGVCVGVIIGQYTMYQGMSAVLRSRGLI